MEGPARQLARHELFRPGPNARHKAEAILLVVILAALNGISIEMQAEGISPDAAFYHLNYKLSIDSVELMMEESIRRSVILLKRRFGGRKFAIAMDYTDEMYYGKKTHGLVVGTKPKAGTCWAHKYFTVSIVTDGGRFFLFSYPVESRSTSHVFFINRAFGFMKELGISPHVLLLDREFNGVDVIAWLEDEGLRYVTPLDHDSKFTRKMAEVKKFPALFNCWQITNADKETVYADVVVLERFDDEGKQILHGFATNMPKNYYQKDVEMLAQLYSRRWGIETAHREEDKFRVYTTCTNGIVRYLFFVVGLLLYNLWVELNLSLCEKMKDFFIQVRIWPMKQCLIRLLGSPTR